MNALHCLLIIYIENSPEGLGTGLPRALPPPTDDFLGTGEEGKGKQTVCVIASSQDFCAYQHRKLQKRSSDMNMSSNHFTCTHPVSFHPWPQRTRFPSCLKLHTLLGFSKTVLPYHTGCICILIAPDPHPYRHAQASSILQMEGFFFFLLITADLKNVLVIHCLPVTCCSLASPTTVPEIGKNYRIPSTGHILKSYFL